MIERPSIELKVFPNPSNDGIFFLSWDNSTPEIKQIKVFDISGRTVFQQNNIAHGFILILSDQRKGLYTVIMELDNQVIRRKLLIR